MLSGGNNDVVAEANRMYDEMREHGIDVLFDDRDLRAGEKFADAELIGIPTRIVVSEKTMAQGGVEVTDRKSGAVSFLADSKVIDHLTE
jgi:prolyl-tRNA synthetase